MNENLKTVVYVALAGIVGMSAWAATRMSAPRVAEVIDETGQPFFPDFKDPLAVARLRIVDFDETTGELRDFEVLNGPKGWTIPSHDSYPADAQRQVEEAAASVIDLKKLGYVSDLPGDQELYGVVDPSTQLERGTTGVGKRVSMEDSGGNRLAEFIIGKTDPEQSKLRFVRVPNQDRIYRVAVDTSRLSTRFQDWIEKDLLKLNSWDVRQVTIDGYSIDELNGVKVPGDQLDLTYNDSNSKWTMAGLPEGEALDDTKLNELKSSLDNLQIVDVRRKPAGLSRDLKAENVSDQERREGLISLHNKGYFLATDGQLLSNEGEVLVGTSEGVEYVLRFGNVAPTVAGEEAVAPAAEGAEGAEGAANPKAAEGENRYLFVMAQPNLDLIPKPEGVDVSDILAGARADEPLEDEPVENEPVEGDATEENQPLEDAADDDTDAASPAADDDAGTEGGGDGALAQAAPAEDPAPDQATEEPAADANAGNEPAAEEPAAEEPAADNAAGEAAPTEGNAPRGTQAIDEAAAKLKAKKDEDRKRDEFEEKVKKAHARVKELNDRFADWYYVISDSMFKKIRLTRAEVLKKPGSGEPTDPVGDAAGGVFPPFNAGGKSLLDLDDPRDLGPPLGKSN